MKIENWIKLYFVLLIPSSFIGIFVSMHYNLTIEAQALFSLTTPMWIIWIIVFYTSIAGKTKQQMLETEKQ